MVYTWLFLCQGDSGNSGIGGAGDRSFCGNSVGVLQWMFGFIFLRKSYSVISNQCSPMLNRFWEGMVGKGGGWLESLAKAVL